MLVSPQIPIWKPNPQCVITGGGDFGRSSGYEGRALMNGIGAFIKEPRELSHPFYHVRTQLKDGHL